MNLRHALDTPTLESDSMNKMRPLCLALALMAPLSWTACNSGATADGEPRLSILLTDAPGDVASAWLRIDEIWLQGGNGNGGREVLLDTPTDWILISDLVGTTLEIVDEVPVTEGVYGQMRLRLLDAALESGDGSLFATGDELPLAYAGREPDGLLHCPSCSQSGFKVNLPGGALHASGGTAIVVLDFDVSQSFGHEAGASGRWVMHPVMHATEIALSGSVGGAVSLAAGLAFPTCGGAVRSLEDFVPLLTPVGGGDALSGNVAVTDPADVEGSYSVPFLTPGDYAPGYEASVELGNGDRIVFEATAAPAGSVTVASDAGSTVDYTVTRFDCDTSGGAP
jgi:hypothetical protein